MILLDEVQSLPLFLAIPTVAKLGALSQRYHFPISASAKKVLVAYLAIRPETKSTDPLFCRRSRYLAMVALN